MESISTNTAIISLLAEWLESLLRKEDYPGLITTLSLYVPRHKIRFNNNSLGLEQATAKQVLLGQSVGKYGPVEL